MESLGIDLRLLIVQIINFALLVFVLTKLVYKPILKLLDDRRKKIEEGAENSKKIEERLVQLQEEEKKILEEAQKKAFEEREELIKLAQTEKDQIIEEARSAASREVQKAVVQIKAAEEEASERLKGNLTKKIVEDIREKLTVTTKKKSEYPLLKHILK